ncbi:hypothetical protein BWI97_23945 [Siphonobacter sp. BAB-5405]|uniref:DUF421 domain-containing protein n=1 Tax=Siphonobacter sp. BAB-5405 TaxID=1864825 RepID=UPI000C7FCBEE|nr:YetF domain-containing protein [Siphonobacter sp. BAB-5405]PMD90521.1 hypothetical protein BWI97_23945 [Siphonobacter sp. BAB-5405]
MNPDDIKIDDWLRIFYGELPASYFIEVIIRMTFVYLLLMVCIRIMGRRMASQLNRNEMAALTSLAAAIGMPVLSPDRGLLPAIAIAIIIVAGQRWISRIASRNEKFEAITQDDMEILVKDGVLELKAMQHSRITRERLFAELRAASILHLGQVRRLYIEANGKFTLIENENPKPGLSVIPNEDPELIEEQPKADDRLVCKNCGNTMFQPLKPEHECNRCKDVNWIPPIKPEA